MDFWFSGAGQRIDYETLIDEIRKHSKEQGQVYIGTDSHIANKHCIYSTAVCLHGAEDQIGGKYFFQRDKFERDRFPTLMERIMHEVENTVSTALKILEECPKVQIELHLDISPSDKQEKTSRFADMMIGYAKGVGFPCKVKPDAFAASTVADKHNK